MNKLVRILSIAMALAAIAALMVAPAFAQEDDEENPGEGGIITYSTFGSGPATFSPIYATDAASNDVVSQMFAGLVAIDPEQESYDAGLPGALASEMELSEDGRTYTLTLRDDMFWTDGEQITIDDVLQTWEIINNPEYNFPYPFYRTQYFESIEAVDENTLEVTFQEPICGSEQFLSALFPVPEHIYSQYSPEELQEADINLDPQVTSGPFQFVGYSADEFTALRGWDDYVDASLGYVNPDGIIQRVYANQTVVIEDFTSPNGEVTVLEGVPANRQQEIRDLGENEGYQVFEFTPGTSWDYMGYNMADPENPQPALDEDGNRIDQGLHPVFGDKLVRQALQQAVNMEDIIEGAVFGEGTQMPAQVVPNSWAFNEELEPWGYDPEAAVEKLAEAGWVPQNADAAPGPDNPLVCDGCLYAQEVDESYNGTEFSFELITNAGNTRREAIASIIQDELEQIGVTVETNFIDFNTLLERVFGGQTFDAYILGWRAGYPNDPDTVQLFGAESDDPASSGSNPTSFYNERYYELEDQALDPAATNGCEREARAEIYAEMQEIMKEESPYFWMYVQNGMYAARPELKNFDPKKGLIDLNNDEWAIVEPE